jgi:hypothetical protein
MTPKANHGELIARWGRADRFAEPSIVYAWGGGGAEKADCRILSNSLEGEIGNYADGLAMELDRRGYDLTTLKFSIKQKCDD